MTFCGKMRRCLQDAITAKRRALAESSIATYSLQFGHIFPAAMAAIRGLIANWIG